MKMKPSALLICLVSLMLCAGCSVKEDRGACPCRLVLDFSEVDASVVERADLKLAAYDGFVFTDELEPEDFVSEMMVPVPRGEVVLGVWSGTADGLTDSGLMIPVGEECPPVYFHASAVDADCEMKVEKVLMRKNHCRMTVRLKNVEAEPVGMEVFGNVNGYHADGTPSAGEFSCELQMNGGDGEVILPRQVDNSLAMEINDGTDVLKYFAIGEYIAETGYDWNAPDLEDIVMEINIAFAKIELVIEGWDEVYEFEVEI